MRNDVHRPTTLVTEDYDYVTAYDNVEGDPGARNGELQPYTVSGHTVMAFSPAGAARVLGEQLVTASKGTRYGTGDQCDHCGAHIRYVAVMHHLPTGDHLAIGETCLGNRFERATADFQAMRKAAQLDREAQRIKAAWTEYLDTHDADWTALYASENPFIADVLRRGRQYGNLSDRQFDAICNALQRDADRAAKLAAEPVEVMADLPVGAQTITGEVLSIKWQQGYMYGSSVCKMLVKMTTDAGTCKVWGTAPAKLVNGNVDRGDVVTFRATVKRSDDTRSFGFFSRPKQPAFVSRWENLVDDVPVADSFPDKVENARLFIRSQREIA